MKKFTYLKSKLAVFCLLTLSIFFNACQTEDAADRNSDSATVTNLIPVPPGDCSSNCIEPGSNSFYPTLDSRTVTWGGRYGNTNSKTVEIKYYNTETHFVLEVKSTSGWSDLVINEQSVWTGGPVAPNVWRSYSYLLPLGWQACDPIDFDLQVSGNGNPAIFDNVYYNLIGICDDGCETSFTGETKSCGTAETPTERIAEYTFTADADQEYIKIQGGLTNFTDADAIVTVTGGDLEVSQWTPGGSSNRIIKVEGSVSECETITIRVTWNSSNSGGIITGEWSVKNGEGLELATPVAGLRCN